ncbi:hypothetical protein MMC22_001179 [Lobaria immixta]|nr:hypothetical protein [Lobaria immixta]
MARLKSSITSIRHRFFPLSYYSLHFCYFVVTTLISSVILKGKSGNEQALFQLRYIDALFLSASAMTCTGLNTVNLGSLTAFQQAVHFILILAGNVTVVSVTTVVVRRHFFKGTMKDIKLKAGQTVFSSTHPPKTEERASAGSLRGHDFLTQHSSQHKTNRRINMSPQYRRNPSSIRRDIESGEINFSSLKPVSSGGFQIRSSEAGLIEENRHDLLSSLLALDKKVSTAFSSAHIEVDVQQDGFQSLTESEREELGGVEYHALSLLMWILPAYVLFWLALPMAILIPYSYRDNVESIIRSQPGNLKPAW